MYLCVVLSVSRFVLGVEGQGSFYCVDVCECVYVYVHVCACARACVYTFVPKSAYLRPRAPSWHPLSHLCLITPLSLCSSPSVRTPLLLFARLHPASLRLASINSLATLSLNALFSSWSSGGTSSTAASAVPCQEPHDLEWLCVAPPCDSPVAAGSPSAESSQLSDFTPCAAATGNAQLPQGEARKRGSMTHLDPRGLREDSRADAPTRIRSKSAANTSAMKGRGLSGSASDARGLLAATCSTPSIQHLLSAASGAPSQGVTGIGLRSMVAESKLQHPRGQETQQPRFLTWLPLAFSRPVVACDKRAAQNSLYKWRVHVWRLPQAPARGTTRGGATWAGRPNVRCCSVVPTSVAIGTKAGIATRASVLLFVGGATAAAILRQYRNDAAAFIQSCAHPS
jgi:hypothetical protein